VTGDHPPADTPRVLVTAVVNLLPATRMGRRPGGLDTDSVRIEPAQASR